MIVTNNVYILTCFLILLTPWNNSVLLPFSNTLNSNKQHSSFLVQAKYQDIVQEQFQRGDEQQKSDQQKDKEDPYNNELLVATLSNDELIPYVGVGVGNVKPHEISNIVSAAFSDGEEESSNLGYHLLDTTRASGNEKLLSKEIARVMSENREKNPKSMTTIHVLTKIWYTHLGYERTKISVQESMDDILGELKGKPYVNVKLHVLIHWPQCYESIKWMNCVDAEKALPTYVQEAGDTVPHQNPLAYLGSWRAMEDMYNQYYPTIASIGVSNFDRKQLDSLLQAARIKPHIYQGNLEMTTQLMPYLRQNMIHPQVYGVFKALTSKRPITKIDVARRHLISLADEMSLEAGNHIFPATLLLSFLLQTSVGIVVRTTAVRNIMQNSPKKIVQGSKSFTPVQTDRLKHILESLHYRAKVPEEEHRVVKANEKVHVTFHNKNLEDQLPVKIEFLGNDVKERETPKVVAKRMEAGQTVHIESHPGHWFAVHNADTGKEISKFQVNADYGKAEWVSLEL